MKDFEELVERGVRLYNEGRYARSASCFERAAALRPADVKAYDYWARALAWSGRAKKALDVLKTGMKSCPEPDPLPLVVGEILLSAKAYQSARSWLSRLASHASYGGRASLLLGTALERMGRLDEAEEAYRAECERDPDHAQAWFERGALCDRLGRLDDAARCLEVAVRRGVLNPEAGAILASVLVKLCRAQAAQRSPEEAEGRLRRAVKLDSMNAEAWSLLGRALEQRGVEAGGPAVPGGFRKGVAARRGAASEAEGCYRKAVGLDPRLGEAWLQWARMAWARGAAEEAEGHARKALEVDGRRPEAWCLLGLILHQRGRMAEAEGCYRRAVGLDPALVDAWSQWARMALALGRWEEAEGHARQALAVDAGSSQAWFLLGQALHRRGVEAGGPAVPGGFRKGVAARRGRAAQAEGCYQKAAELDPGLVDAWFQLAAMSLAQGRVEEAEARARKALAIDGKRAQTWSLLGKVLAERGDSAEAQRCCREALARDPGLVEAEYLLGLMALSQDRLQEAEKYLRRSAAAMDERHVGARLALGRLLDRQGRTTEAEAAYAEAASAAPDDLDVHLELGRVYQQRGMIPQAETRYRRAADLDVRPWKARRALVEFLKDQAMFDEALEVLRGIRRDLGKDAGVDFDLGWIHGKKREYGLMRKRFRSIVLPRPAVEADLFKHLCARLCIKEYASAFKTAEAILDLEEVKELETFFNPWPRVWRRDVDRAFYEEQLSALDLRIRRHPGSPWAGFFMGTIRYLLQDDGGGLAALERLPRLREKRYGWMRYLSGLVRLASGRYRPAREDFSAAVRSRPDFWLAQCHLAESLLCLGSPRRAFGLFERLLARRSLRRVFSEVSGWYGEVLLWTGHYDRARRALDAAVSEGSGLAVCWRGAVHLLENRYEEAQRDLDRAIVPGSRDAEAYTWRGELFRRMKRYPESLRDCDRAVELGGTAWAYCNRALTHAALGDKAAMRRDFASMPEGPRVAGHIEKRLGLKRDRPRSDAQIRRILETGLVLAGGIRRPEAYLHAVWMKR
ncbi:MAG: tetratricopeptide repeat protein [Elusimicrobia bacterium]|nr:tetratricopeptide repeat protein [Elusimicrobiota bacterium]